MGCRQRNNQPTNKQNRLNCRFFFGFSDFRAGRLGLYVFLRILGPAAFGLYVFPWILGPVAFGLYVFPGFSGRTRLNCGFFSGFPGPEFH